MSCGGFFSCTLTLNLIASVCCWPVVAALIGLEPTSVTVPSKVLLG